MATRFYLPSSSTAPSIAPAYGTITSWTVTTGADRVRMSTTKSNTSLTDKAYSDSDATDQSICRRQYISDRLGPGTYGTGTIKHSIRCSETDAKNNLYLYVAVALLDTTGTKKTQIIDWQDTTELATSLASRYHSVTSASFTAVKGDYIGVEIGVRGDPGVGGSHSSSINFGDVTAGADLDAADADTGTDNPWLEFSVDIAFSAKTRLLLGVGI